jgi:hypothetical protein
MIWMYLIPKSCPKLESSYEEGKSTRGTRAARHMVTHVPGPLHITCNQHEQSKEHTASGLDFKAFKLPRKLRREVDADVNQD